MPRRPFLSRVPVDEARRLFSERVVLPDPLPEEEVALDDALGRVAARPVVALVSAPAYHAAAMDGFAVRRADTAGASEATPVFLKGPDAPGIDTGDPLPAGFDAVVRVEDVVERDGGIEIGAALAPWENVRLTGEDIVEGEVVLPAGRRLGPFDVAAAFAAGHTRIHVRRRPVVALIPTGDEIVEPGVRPQPGQIPEFNCRMLAAMVAEWGGEPRRFAPVADDRAALEAALAEALAECDVVAINAGSSAGREDLTPDVVSAAGEVLVHGINVMPGKPTVLGVCGGKAVLGLPGYPVSAAVAAELFLGPLVAAWLGAAPPTRETLRARMERKVPSKAGHAEVVRVQVGRIGGGYVASPLGRGAGAVTTLSRAAGLVRVPERSEGLPAGTEVEVELLRPLFEVDAALLHVGSHDLLLDLVAELLGRRMPGVTISSANVGSLAGLVALGRGEAHFAGCHLLEPETGDYNVSFVRRYLPGRRVALLHLAQRRQGLMVLPGNPRGLRSVADLARPGVRLVNRQRGAGTRVLLDHLLARAGIDPASIRGYDHELPTHTAVAVAVLSDAADVGLGIAAAARGLGLEFVPLDWERYDLAILEETFAEPRIQALRAVLSDPELRRRAEALGGYDAAASGEVRWVEP